VAAPRAKSVVCDCIVIDRVAGELIRLVASVCLRVRVCVRPFVCALLF